MGLVTNVIRRGAVYYFRRRVPEDLQPQIGRPVIRESLKTRDPAEARRRAAERNLQWERAFENAEKAQIAKSKSAAVRTELSPAEFEGVIAEYRRHLLASDETIRLHGLGGRKQGMPDDQFQLYGEVLEDVEQITATSIARGRHMEQTHLEEVDDHLARLHIALDRNCAAYKRLAVEMLNTFAECVQLWKQRQAGKVVRTPEKRPVEFGEEKRVTADELIKAWALDRTPAEKTAYTFNLQLKAFEAHLKGRNLACATKDDGLEWKESLLGGGKTAKTVRNYMYGAGAVLNWAVENRKIPLNPLAGIRVGKKGSKAKSDRRSFTDEEAARILSAVRSKTGFWKWIPWLAAFSGARVAELAQLEKSDVSGDSKMAFMTITNLSDDEAQAQEDGAEKSVKTDSSKRKVPLHPQVIEEGFLDFVSKSPDGPLFRDLTPDRFGSRGGSASKRLGRFIRETLEMTDRRLGPSHSWRHRFKQVCDDNDIPEKAHDGITGHAPNTEGRKYGAGMSPATLHRWMQKFPRIEV